VSGLREYPAEPPLSGWRAATASLRHQQFRWIFGSNQAFFFAMNGQFVVRSYLAFKLTDSALALGVINLAVAVPMLLVSPFGGVISDRVERRNLILAGQAAVVLSELTILLLLLADALAFWHLVSVVLVMGVAFPFIMPARQAIVVSIVGRDRLANAMALQMGGMNAARVAGPALAGLVIAKVSVEGMYVIALGLYAVALAAMLRVHRAPPAGEAGRSMFQDMVAGFRYVRDDAPVRALMVLSILPIMLAMPFQALLVVFAEDVWEVGANGLGALQAAAGFGGILGSVYVAWRSESRRKVRIMLSTLLAFGGTLFLFAISPWFWLALPLVLVADVFVSVFTTVNGTAIQMLIPDAVRGRVMSLMMMTFGLTPLGTLPVSAAAEAFGAPGAVAGAALLMSILAMAFWASSGALRAVDGIAHSARPAPFDGPRGPEARPAGRVAPGSERA
jgi:predicted MFS family arabinose efflux permease